MTSVLILGFLVGVLAVNGVLHFIAGTRKGKMPVLGKKLPVAVGVFWGWLELIVAVLLWHVAPMAIHPRAAFVAVSAGVLVAGLIVSFGWLDKLVHKN